MEIAVGYLCAWLVAKARRVAGRADAEVDRGLDAGMERLHELVSGALGEDPAFRRAAAEAESGDVSPRTRRRLVDALDEAAEQRPELAASLREALSAFPAAPVASGDGIAVGGDVDIRADRGSAAALRIGDVTLGPPPEP
ncbi:hypothetical protein [Actinacidiphila alni]|uniref:hypothetical protein n=1 Tax=Actinacidiphila alni TaxID=380248 RepID=UPI003452685A